MRALFLTAPLTFDYREIPSPKSIDGWVRIRTEYVGICGSDIHYYATGRIGDQIVKYPFILGHEMSGTVEDGSGYLAKHTPVYIEPAIACHQCDQCRAGRENTCRNLRFLGNPQEQAGCMCEELVMPAECAVPLPEWMGLEEAVLLEPLSIAAYSVVRSRALEGCKAAIAGAGPIGLSVLLALGDLDAQSIYVSEPIAERRDAALKLGAEIALDPGLSNAAAVMFEASCGGVDVAFDCAGTQESIDDATKALAPGGTLVLIGIPENQDLITYDPHLMRRREITVVHIRRQNKAVEKALSILRLRRDAAQVLVTHRFAPRQAAEAFGLIQRKAEGAIKALLKFQP